MSLTADIRVDRPHVERSVDLAAWVFGRPFSLALGLIAAAWLVSWLPHYLTWPYWADHDVFANAARAWDRGEKPYRDLFLNNFPGTIYVFYLLGKTIGWGRTWAFYGFDASLVLAFVAVLVGWSRRRFGRSLPGLVGVVVFLSFYLSLDYSRSAQRDFQAPCLALLAILAAQAWPGRASLVGSAVLAALGFSIRPQVVLFLPGLILAVSRIGELGEARVESIKRAATWLLVFSGAAALLFLPLVLDGIFVDFLRSLRRVAFGSSYNRVRWDDVAIVWLAQGSYFQWFLVPAAIGLLGHRSPNTSTGLVWLLAFAGATFYKPLSPVPHSYTEIPLAVTWSVVVAILAGLIVSKVQVPDLIKFAAVLALVCMTVPTLRPASCALGPNLQAASTLWSGIEPEVAPPGYRHGIVPTAAFYPWQDYRAVLLYIRTHTDPSTRIANALKGDPAIVAEVGRPSAFPAEAITWLKMVEHEDEPVFADALDRATNSVVIWTPGSFPPNADFRIPIIEAAIRRHYRFEARFGMIEVWRRRDDLVSRRGSGE